MADKVHLNILKEGVETWNQWRSENPQQSPNISGVNHTGADLRRANLTGTDISKTNLSGANFTEAILSEANLRGVNLTVERTSAGRSLPGWI
jgi:uncharacterized protein YjbI with pentapeptide repeats